MIATAAASVKASGANVRASCRHFIAWPWRSISVGSPMGRRTRRPSAYASSVVGSPKRPKRSGSAKRARDAIASPSIARTNTAWAW